MMKKVYVPGGLIAIALIVLFGSSIKPLTSYATVPGENRLITVNTSGDGQGGNGHSDFFGTSYGETHRFTSYDGEYIGYTSAASNLVAGDTNGFDDVFVTNTASNTTTRINIAIGGGETNAHSEFMNMSENARYIVYMSKANNLPNSGSSTTNRNVYLYDSKNQSTERILSGNAASYGKVWSISNDGRYLLYNYSNPSTGFDKLYVLDRTDNTTKQLNLGTDNITQNVQPHYPQMSCDGSFVTFVSAATNLSTNDTNGKVDVFLADLRGDTTKIKNITEIGNGDAYIARISCNGSYIGFSSAATNTVTSPAVTGSHYYMYDRLNETFELIDQSSSGTVANQDISQYARDLTLSDTGVLAFRSKASNIVATSNNYINQVYIRDTKNDTTELLSKTSVGNASSPVGTSSDSTQGSSITSDGKLVVYSAMKYSNLVPGHASTNWDIITSKTGL